MNHLQLTAQHLIHSLFKKCLSKDQINEYISNYIPTPDTILFAHITKIYTKDTISVCVCVCVCRETAVSGGREEGREHKQF